MRLASTLAILLALASSALASPALAQGNAPRPQKLGDFGSWTAATFTEDGRKVCYAFARPSRSEPGGRQGVLLSVSHRAGARDTVTISSGYTYPRNADATLAVGPTSLPFYTAGSTAAARDGAAAVRAFRNGREAVLKGPAQNGRGTVTDTFPLAGFGAAHDAITKECPAAAPPPARRR
jgi:invasion protein IalB